MGKTLEATFGFCYVEQSAVSGWSGASDDDRAGAPPMTTARRPFHGFRFPADLPGSGGAEAASGRDDRCGRTTPAGVTTVA